MHALREIQKRFADSILWGSDAGAIRVYRNNVFISLAGALAAVYPVTRRLVGEGFFAQAARRFIREYPSRSGNLHGFGRELPAFLAALRETAELPYLPDVAALEWAYHEVFHEGEAPPFDFRRLADPEHARLRLQPALRLVASRWPILDIWQANQAQDVPSVHLEERGAWLAVVRRGLERFIEPLSSGEFALLHAVQAAQTLGEACAAAVAAEPELDLSAAMRRFVQLELFSSGDES